MGGHGLYASVGEYMKFIRMWLNDGAGAHGRVLKKETVEAAVRNGLEAHQTVVMLPGVIPTLSNDAEFFPGLKKSWSYTFMVNNKNPPTGRPTGAIAWAGLAEYILLDRSAEWVRGILGDANSSVRRSGFVWRLSGFRDGCLCDWCGSRGSVTLPSGAAFFPRRRPGFRATVIYGS